MGKYSNKATSMIVPPLEINNITILKNVSKIKSRRENKRSKANNINAMM